MKTKRNILVAFLLNLAFAAFELVGGMVTGSVAIISDALHDLGDAAGIGIAYFMERKSAGEADERYTFGYGRYSVLGGAITMLILLLGSVAVIANAAARLASPTPIHYDGMIVFAVVGVAVNLLAAFVTREGDSINQKAVNLHMLEDVLGWAVVLVGATVMRFTDLAVLDPLMSIGVAVFILIHAGKGLWQATQVFLEKAPESVDVRCVADAVAKTQGVADVHHMHLWTIDGHEVAATMHIVAEGEPSQVKAAVKQTLAQLGIVHATLELETATEHCCDHICRLGRETAHEHCHHHHHH